MSDEPPPAAEALLSPTNSTGNQPSWPRPRTPIPPHRLAKLANALGISTPVPHSHSPPDSSLSTSVPRSSAAESWRSATPSVASTSHLTSHSPSPGPPTPTKFLLHVIPPLHLPHETDSSESIEYTPPPSNASGYHTQFRRGTLVPVFPTLQHQLWAIAKEYALPSTAGMILYLVSSSPNPNTLSTPSPPKMQQQYLDPQEEPGPRLSEDVWKHLWTRVLKAEREAFPPSGSTPGPIGLGFAFGGRSSPDPSTPSNPLRPLAAGRFPPQHLGTPLTPSASTPSTTSASRTQAASSEPSHSGLNTPDTSFPPESRADALELPGLHSPSLIPILAKVEFDIDKRKAAWYGPWIRSRKMNQRKRDESRVRGESLSLPLVEDESGGSDSERVKTATAPIPLKIVDRQAVPRFLLSAEERLEDASLADSPTELEEDPDGTAKYGPAAKRALGEDEDVHELWDAQGRPQLSVAIPSSPPNGRRRSSPTTSGTIRRGAPPPLRLMPSTSTVVASAEPSPLPTTDSTKLAYLREGIMSGSEDETGDEADGLDPESFRRIRSPTEDKRVGAFFEDLDLGIEFEDSGEFDETDPNDRRRSQYAMRAKLDEIERALVQFSPRRLKHEHEFPESPALSSPRSAALSANGRSPPSTFLTVSNGSPLKSQSAATTKPPVWPAVPYSSLNALDEDDQDKSLGLDEFPSPPKLALNGVSNAIPTSPYRRQFLESQESESDESKARRRELEGHDSYPEIMPPSLRKSGTSNSPIIPLSPDPFGRFPSEPAPPAIPSDGKSSLDVTPPVPKQRITYSTFEVPPERRSSLSRNGSVASNSDRASTAHASRFSVDSTDEQLAKNNRAAASLNPVKSIRTLWRKSRKASISSVAGAALALQAGASGQTSPALPSPEIPPVPMSASRTEMPIPPLPQEVVTNATLPPGRRPSPGPFQNKFMTSQAMQKAQKESSINSIHFDQESPYPIRRSPQPPSAPLPRSSSSYANSQQTRLSSMRQSSEDSVGADALPSPSLSSDRGSTRKSILKSWRSTNTSQATPNTSAPSEASGRSSTDSQSARKRRPSVIELVRGSIVNNGSHNDIPPSPLLPEQYMGKPTDGGSRMSSVRTSSANGRNTPSSFESSSRLSSAASPPAFQPSSLPPSPPRPGRGPAVSRPSQEEDQFEMIDAPPLGHGKTPSLSYPYHELDHRA
ncbi:hypothetical protein BV25DRAFT_1875168 [Artomyces pyxidatus]|uniref:Uncharacterized protein n=1 Tax=Artomyces pyxidatus TaxID=48021 RepID=A0ACB8THY5_9AGAM|nr:hypothetical protein BV25DRAFT_1875168 [Artomyces pyxidatus]